jgi:hypothetical protein
MNLGSSGRVLDLSEITGGPLEGNSHQQSSRTDIRRGETENQGNSPFPYRECWPEATLCYTDNSFAKLERRQDDPRHLVRVGVAETRGLWETEPNV